MSLNSCGFAKRFRLVYMLPRQINVRSTEVAECSCLAIDRAAQVQHIDNACRTQIKQLSNDLSERFVRNNARPLRIYEQRNRMRYANRIGQFDFTAFG